MQTIDFQHNLQDMMNTMKVMKMKLTLASLRAFCAVAECLSFTQAAARVFRTQPALSRQIAQLESGLGLRLFDRDGRQLRLTPAGRDLYDRARRLLGEVDDFSARAQAFAGGTLGSIRVGGTGVGFDSILTQALGIYRQEWPNISVEFFELGTAELMRCVASGELDFAVCRYVNSDTVVGERLFAMHLVAVVGPRHRWVRAKQIEVAELSQEPLLLRPSDAGSRILFESACRQCGVHPREIRMESDSSSTLAQMAQVHHGVAVALSTILISQPHVHAIPVVNKGQRIGEWAGIMWRAGTELAPYATAFIQTAISVAQSKPRKPASRSVTARARKPA